MNSFTQTFQNSELEKSYFEDQIQELMDFYLWVCCLGSSVSLFTFIWEFVNPLGMGIIQYFSLLVPTFFYLSYKLLQKKPQLFNFILLSFNLSYGIITVYVYVNMLSFEKQLYFMSGQAIALIQFSLLVGTKIFGNLMILAIVQLVIITIDLFQHANFTSIHIMHFSAIVLMAKSIWSNNKTKRQFFVLRHLSDNIHESLNTIFGFGIIHCKYNQRSCRLEYQQANSWLSRYFVNQEQFIQFLRSYSTITSPIQSFKSQVFNKFRSDANTEQVKQSSVVELTLELIIFKFITSKTPQSLQNSPTYQVYSKNQAEGLTVTLHLTIQDGEKTLVVLVQANQIFAKTLKQKAKIRRLQESLRQFLSISKNLTEGLGLINYRLIENSQKINISQFHHPLLKLYKTVNGYYNLILYNKIGQIGVIKSFYLKQFILNLNFILKEHLSEKRIEFVPLANSQLEIQTNYLQLMQLVLNILLRPNILDHINRVVFKVEAELKARAKCVHFHIYFHKLQNYQIISEKNLITQNQQRDSNKQEAWDQSRMISSVNRTILEVIGFDNRISERDRPECNHVSFRLIQDLFEFRQELPQKNK